MPKPDMAATISADSYKILICSAVDYAMNEEYAMARVCLRLALFLEQWAKQGGAALVWFLAGGCRCKEPWAAESRKTMAWLEDCADIEEAILARWEDAEETQPPPDIKGWIAKTFQ